MTPYVLTLLICSATLPHDGCDDAHARLVTHAPEHIVSLQQCAFMGMSMIAPTAQGPEGKEYMIVKCTPYRGV